MLVPRNPSHGPESPCNSSEAGDERARIVEPAPRQVEGVLALFLLHLPAPHQLQVPRGSGAAGRASIDLLRIRPAAEQESVVEAEGETKDLSVRAVAGVAELQSGLPARQDLHACRRLGHPGLLAGEGAQVVDEADLAAGQGAGDVNLRARLRVKRQSC